MDGRIADIYDTIMVSYIIYKAFMMDGRITDIISAIIPSIMNALWIMIISVSIETNKEGKLRWNRVMGPDFLSN